MTSYLNAVKFFAALGRYFSRAAVRALFLDSGFERKKDLVRRANKDSHNLLKSLNFQLTVFGYDDAVHGNENFLIVSNHMSYLDPFIMAAAIPSLFITSVDMGEVFGLGQICRAAGCIFVERRNRTTVEKDLAQMTESLKAGLNVTIYPEGTSTNGKTVLPFKKSLLMAAVFAEKRLLPVVLKYVEIDGQPFCEDNADTVCWYADMTFTPHFLKLMSVKSLKAELHFLEPLSTTTDSQRDELSASLHGAISRKYLALS